jgi:hypothetical protein
MSVILEWFNDALRTSEVILTFEERYKDIGCQICKALSRTISGRGQLRNSPRKSSRWDLFPEPDCVTSIRWAQLRITFYLWKKNGPRKPEMFYITFDCYHLNQARIRTLSVLSSPSPTLGPGSGPCRPLPRMTCNSQGAVWDTVVRSLAHSDLTLLDSFLRGLGETWTGSMCIEPHMELTLKNYKLQWLGFFYQISTVPFTSHILQRSCECGHLYESLLNTLYNARICVSAQARLK